MFARLQAIAQGRVYWWLLIVLGVAMEAIALIYQYGFDYLPCVLCIHTRIWIMGIILVAVAGLLLHNNWRGSVASHGLNTIMVAGLLERSWMLFAVERGFVFGSCDMKSGLPEWFALDQWFPSLFKVWEACGYTPYLLFKISMAEVLLVMSAVLVVVSATLTLARFTTRHSA